jgi:hypothetical protein
MPIEYLAELAICGDDEGFIIIIEAGISAIQAMVMMTGPL